MASGMGNVCKIDMLRRFSDWHCLCGRNRLNRLMCKYFSSMTGHNFRGGDIIDQLLPAELHGGFDTKTCDAFRDWFCKIDSCWDPYEEFEALAQSEEFQLLCLCLYEERFFWIDRQRRVTARSSNGVVFEMDKRVAAAESVVFNEFVSASPNETGRGLAPRGEIPLNFTGDVVSELFHFMKKKNHFSYALKGLVDKYKAWFTEYLKRNRAILPDLHEAAGVLSIPGLLELTTLATQEVGGLIGNTIEEVSRWCGNLSVSKMLSSLTARAGEDVRDQETSRFLPFFS